jgi:hypothetical protein
MSELKKPWWVRASLFGSPTRKAQWSWVFLSLATAIGALTYALIFGARTGYGGVVLFGSAWMYWQTIRWMDAHNAW